MLDEESVEMRTLAEHFLDEDDTAPGVQSFIDLAHESLPMHRAHKLQGQDEKDDRGIVQRKILV